MTAIRLFWFPTRAFVYMFLNILWWIPITSLKYFLSVVLLLLSILNVMHSHKKKFWLENHNEDKRERKKKLVRILCKQVWNLVEITNICLCLTEDLLNHQYLKLANWWTLAAKSSICSDCSSHQLIYQIQINGRFDVRIKATLYWIRNLIEHLAQWAYLIKQACWTFKYWTL